ncbi:hypothetical protein HPB50_015499 [Hyalomma asiaticum]|uniref:Uncharacterized protein n=1 Tax=Hyalomma asiaticum TaxID=266040 RepID=A0ACB7S2V6_HYAAI|nr:hypothetical protein HPB50_015499 [Hyalomma asiaticum]
MRENEEYPLADSKVIVTSYVCGPLDAADCDIGSVYEDQIDDPHRDRTITSGSREDDDVSSGVEAGSRESVRNRDEFHDANSIFQSEEGERSVEKKLGFAFCRESSRTDEVRRPLDGDDECHTNLDMGVANTDCVSPVGDTCGAGMVECHADDLAVREGSSQDDANGVCVSKEENRARVLLPEFQVESREVMVGGRYDGAKGAASGCQELTAKPEDPNYRIWEDVIALLMKM